MGMDQYLLIPFLVGWTSIYQLFWCSPGVQGFDTLPHEYMVYWFHTSIPSIHHVYLHCEPMCFSVLWTQYNVSTLCPFNGRNPLYGLYILCSHKTIMFISILPLISHCPWLWVRTIPNKPTSITPCDNTSTIQSYPRIDSSPQQNMYLQIPIYFVVTLWLFNIAMENHHF